MNWMFLVVYFSSKEFLVGEKDKDTILGLMPFFHIYGQVGVMLSCLRLGIKTVIMSKFDPELYMKTLEKFKVREFFTDIFAYSPQTASQSKPFAPEALKSLVNRASKTFLIGDKSWC